MITETPPPGIDAPPPRRRSIAKRLLLVFLLLAVLAVFGAVAFLLWADSKIDRIDAADLPSLSLVEGETRTFLLVGTDDRSDLPDDFDHFGDFAGSRTDTIILVNFTLGEGAQMLSIPRDLRVEIPGEGTNRINAAFVFGGPELLINTLHQNLAIGINNYVEIDLAGFAHLVDALGGVDIRFDHPARDGKSGLDVGDGVQTLNGEEALAFVRSREYEELQDGDWVSVGASDIGRTRRQQDFLLALFDQAASRRNAFDLPGFASTVAEEVTVDSGLGLGLIIELGRAALGLSTSDIEARTLPVTGQQGSDGRAYVVPTSEAEPVLSAFRAGLPFPPE